MWGMLLCEGIATIGQGLCHIFALLDSLSLEVV